MHFYRKFSFFEKRKIRGLFSSKNERKTKNVYKYIKSIFCHFSESFWLLLLAFKEKFQENCIIQSGITYSSFWNKHKSDYILNGIMLTNVCNLTEQKIADFIEKCEWKTLEVPCFIRISLFFYKKMRIYVRIPWKQRKYQIRICSAVRKKCLFFRFFSMLFLSKNRKISKSFFDENFSKNPCFTQEASCNNLVSVFFYCLFGPNLNM